MIFTDRTIIVQKGTSSINDTIILYRGDKGVEIRFTLNEGSPFKFGSGASPNIIEKTEAAYGQLVIKTPNDLPSIFSEIVPTNEGKIIFTITAEMIDEITEVGNYTFQIRLFDESRNSRATIPEVVNGIEIREPIAAEDVSTTNEVGVATVGYALTTAGTTEDTFDSQGNYNKTTWGTGDRITAAKLNKIEAGIDGVNKKVASGGTGSSGANIDDTTASTTTTYSSNKIETIKEGLSSQINDIVNVADLAQEGNNIYIKDSDGNKIGNGITIQTSGTSTSSVRLYNTEPIGELFDEPTGYTYLAWPAGNLKYDKNIDKYVCIVNAANQHIFTTLKQYICFINPNTFEVSSLTEIVVTDTTLDQKAICNFTILDDGSYMMIALVNKTNHKIVSSNNGVTWTDSGAIIGNTGQHFWAIYKLSNGRLIGSIDVGNKGLWYSDNNGDSWTNVIPSGTPGDYNAEGCIIELSENNLMCIARKNMSGVGVSSSGDSDKAIISYSSDNGTSWTAWQESASISMNASCCTAIVHDNLVELFAGNRWYHRGDYTCNEYTNTGKNGAIKHYTATIQNALSDNFTDNGVIVYANTPADNSDTAQDFHCPCVARKDKDMLLVYFDRINDGSASATNYHFIRGSLNQLSYKPNDVIVSNSFSYSSKYTKILFNNMLEKINALQYALSQIPGSGVDVPSGSVIYTFEWASDSGTRLHLAENSPVLGNSYGLNSLYFDGEKGNGEFTQQIFAIPFTKSNFVMYANVKFKEYNAIIGIRDTDGFHGVFCANAVNWANGDGTFSVPKAEWINNYHTLKIVKNNNKYTMYVDDVEYTCPVCTSSDIANYYLISESKTYYKVNAETGNNTTETIVPSPTTPYMYLYTGNMGVYISEFKIGEWDS